MLSADSRAAGFTNEVGVGGTIRYLRNAMGLWLLQESLRARGAEASLPAPLPEEAAAVPAFAAPVDPGDHAFLPPGDMPARIAAHCGRTGQRPPGGRAETVRCVLESLALGHRAAIVVRNLLWRTPAGRGRRVAAQASPLAGSSSPTLGCRATITRWSRPPGADSSW